MKALVKFSTFVTVFALLMVLVVAPIVIAQAAPLHVQAPQTAIVQVQPQEPAPVSLPDLVETLETLGGWALLVPALINIGKKAGKISDGQAPAWSLGLNAAGLATLVVLQLTGKFDLVPILDKDAGALAVAINAIIGLVFQLYVSRKSYEEVLAGMPLIGKSFSGRHAGEGPAIEVDGI